MNREVVIACVVNGAGPASRPSEPVTPAEIAEAARQAAEAGAAIVHLHVHDPDTGRASRHPTLYNEVVDRLRAADTDLILSLTSGMGGLLALGPVEEPDRLDRDATDLVGATERLVHVALLQPELCTLRCGSLNAADNAVDVHTPALLREMVRQTRELGARPELQVFDTGQIATVADLIADGLPGQPAIVQLCLGTPHGAPDDPALLDVLIRMLPAGTVFSASSTGSRQLAVAELSVRAGGHVRVGLGLGLDDDATGNAALVASAVAMARSLGSRVVGPAEAREMLGLQPLARWR